MADTEILDNLESEEYKYGFSSNVETDVFPPGLNEDIIRRISAVKNEPDWLFATGLR